MPAGFFSSTGLGSPPKTCAANSSACAGVAAVGAAGAAGTSTGFWQLAHLTCLPPSSCLTFKPRLQWGHWKRMNMIVLRRSVRSLSRRRSLSYLPLPRFGEEGRG